MQQRREPHDSLDDFPTQPWATRALVEHVLKPVFGDLLFSMTCWEPACNRGYMVRPLRETFHRVYASDVHDYGVLPDAGVSDFLFQRPPDDIFREQWGCGPGFIITNPPFRLAESFIYTAASLCHFGAAMLVRTSFLEGQNRYRSLFRDMPPTLMAQFSERVPLVKGRVDREASSATSYIWLVWLKHRQREPLQWIPPCRKALEKNDDYLPEYAA
jgi:hypothetical protein